MATSCRRSNRRIATPALVTHAYVVALATAELGVYREGGLDAHVELLPSLDAVNTLRDGASEMLWHVERGSSASTIRLGMPRGR
jgi:hypothetical protein